MSIPKVMLLATIVPGVSHVGAIFLRDLCLAYPRGYLVGFSVGPTQVSLDPDLDWIPYEEFLIPRWPFSHQYVRYLYRFLGFIIRFVTWGYYIPVGVRRIVRMGKKHNVDTLWVILDDPVPILIARCVARLLNARLIITIMDPPDSRMPRNQHYDRVTRRFVQQEFGRVLRQSVRCGVASESMAVEYRTRFGINPVVLIHGAHPSDCVLPSYELRNCEEFVIGFAGTLYAYKEWDALLDALTKVNWELEGRKVKIRVLTSQFKSAVHYKVNIEFLGWRTFSDTVQLLAQTDIVYLPYWFSKDHDSSARLCFPNKLTTYLAAGRPVFYHGPEYTSPSQFLKRYPFGLACYTLDPEDIIETLRLFIVDKAGYAAAVREGQKALCEELHLSVFRRRFASLIGINEEDLHSL